MTGSKGSLFSFGMRAVNGYEALNVVLEGVGKGGRLSADGDWYGKFQGAESGPNRCVCTLKLAPLSSSNVSTAGKSLGETSM